MVILPPLKTNHTAIMKKYLVPVLIWLGTALPAMAQNGTEDPVLFTVAGEPVTRSEFLYVYQKNNPTKQGDFSEASLQEYLDLYINFKLKVAGSMPCALTPPARCGKNWTNTATSSSSPTSTRKYWKLPSLSIMTAWAQNVWCIM